MKAIVFEGGSGLDLISTSIKAPEKNEVKINLKGAGLNGRDLFVINDSMNTTETFILGSDGAGTIESLGENVHDFKINDEVIINPSLFWHSANAVPEIPQILGSPTDGTFAESVIVSKENIIKKPEYLTWQEASVLSLSALTAYRALFTKGKLRSNHHLLIPGIGSGVATYALMFAKAIGATVSVTSRDEKKLQKAKRLGADHLLNTSDNWKKQMKNNKVDVILDSIGSVTFPKYFELLKPNGTIINFGQSSGSAVNLSLKELFFSQFNILGTSMGSKEEFEQMIQFITQYQIKPIIDIVYPLSDYSLALERMEKGIQFGNIALDIDF